MLPPQSICRGFYPKGRGEVIVSPTPVKELTPITLTEQGHLTSLKIHAFVAGAVRPQVHYPHPHLQCTCTWINTHSITCTYTYTKHSLACTFTHNPTPFWKSNDKGCGYSTSTRTSIQVRVPVTYICMGSSHSCAVVPVALTQKQCHRLDPTVRNNSPLNLYAHL